MDKEKAMLMMDLGGLSEIGVMQQTTNHDWMSNFTRVSRLWAFLNHPSQNQKLFDIFSPPYVTKSIVLFVQPMDKVAEL